MLAISLMRMGAKGKPFYRLVVKEKRSKRDGKYLENVGTYNPMLDPAEVILNHDRIQYWIGVGAQPTDTVKSLIKNNPVQTEEEKAAAMAARAERREAEKLAAEEARKAAAAEKALEAEKLAAEKAAADKAAAEAAEAEAVEAEAAETVEADAAETEAAPEPEAESPEAESAEA